MTNPQDEMDPNNREPEETPGELLTIQPMTLAFYRSRTALRIKLMYPTVRPGETYPQLGGFMFTFAEAASEGSKFGWEKNQAISFFLSAAEVGGFVNALEQGKEIKIYHDPDKGKQNEGTRAKTLSIKGGFLNMTSAGRNIGIKIAEEDERQLALMLGHSLRLCYGWF